MIHCETLTHQYVDGEFALDQLTLHISRGECFGLIGANGAGKSTLIRILATLLVPTSGRARVDNLDVVGDHLAVRRAIGYMPEVVPVFPEFRVGEFLEYTAALYNVAAADRRRRVDAVIALTDLGDKREQWCAALSQGMRQRLYLARALVHDPPVLLLDEPTAGLDPAARIEFRQVMQDLVVEGKTILISSHILPELSEFCTSVGIVERGKLVIAGKVADVMDRVSGTRQIEVQVLGNPSQAMALLRTMPGVQRPQVDGGRVLFEFTGGRDAVAPLLKSLTDANIAVVAFGERHATLEQIFMKVAAFETS